MADRPGGQAMTLSRRTLLKAASAVILTPMIALAQTPKPTTPVTTERRVCIRARGHIEQHLWAPESWWRKYYALWAVKLELPIWPPPWPACDAIDPRVI